MRLIKSGGILMAEPVHVLNAVGNMGMGGMETLIMNIYRNIDREKVQFDFLIHTSREGEYADEIKKMGGRIFHMPVLQEKPHIYYWRYFAYKNALKKLFKEHPEISIVHGHMTNTASIYMPIAMKYGNVKTCIAHSHQSEATPGLQGKVTNFLQRNLSTIATDCFACSEVAAQWIYPKEMIRSNKVTIIRNGVETKRFHYNQEIRRVTRDKLGIQNKLVIGNVARFKKQKNHAFLIDIFREIQKMHPDSVLVLVGIGELLEPIRDRVRSYGLEDSVLFLGGRSDVPDLMNAFDVFLLPSLFEGLPLVGIEAQCAGLPLITSTAVSEETNVTGNVKFLSLEMPPEKWAEEVIETCQKHIREDLVDAVKEKGYDIQTTADWLQNFYIQKAMKK